MYQNALETYANGGQNINSNINELHLHWLPIDSCQNEVENVIYL